MSTVSTDGLGLGENLLTPGHWQACHDDVRPRSDVSTESLEMPPDGPTASCRLHPMRLVSDAVEGIFRRILPSERSREIDPAWSVVMGRPQEDEWPVADFFEPVTLDWDPDILDARAAARRYSEQIDADY